MGLSDRSLLKTWSPPQLHITMNTFALVATIAVAIPAVICFIPSGISVGAGSSLPVLSLGSASLAGSGLAIGGLASGTALAAGAGALAAGALARGGASGRGKRSVESDEQTGEKLIFDALDAMDKNGCGKRYVCELAATPVELLTQPELTSLLLFQVHSPFPESSKAKYDEAVKLGALSRSAQACQTRYSTCPTL